MYFDRNISENKYGKKNEGSYLSCVKNGEFYFRCIQFSVLSSNWSLDLLKNRVNISCLFNDDAVGNIGISMVLRPKIFVYTNRC